MVDLFFFFFEGSLETVTALLGLFGEAAIVIAGGLVFFRAPVKNKTLNFV